MKKNIKIVYLILLALSCGCRTHTQSDEQEKYEKQLAKIADSLNAVHNNERKQRSEKRKIEVKKKVQISSEAEGLIDKINNELKAFGKWGTNSMVDNTGCYFQVDPNVDFVLLRNNDIAVKANQDKNRIYIKYDDIFSIGFRKGIYNVSMPNEKRFFRLNFVVASNKSKNVNDHYAFNFEVYDVGSSSLELYKDLVALTNMVSPVLHYEDNSALKEAFKRPIKEVDETDKRFNYNF